jgi:hypothetical protein
LAKLRILHLFSMLGKAHKLLAFVDVALAQNLQRYLPAVRPRTEKATPPFPPALSGSHSDSVKEKILTQGVTQLQSSGTIFRIARPNRQQYPILPAIIRIGADRRFNDGTAKC